MGINPFCQAEIEPRLPTSPTYTLVGGMNEDSHHLLLLTVLHTQPAPLVMLRACQLDRAPQVKQTEECLAYESKLVLNVNYGWATPH